MSREPDENHVEGVAVIGVSARIAGDTSLFDSQGTPSARADGAAASSTGADVAVGVESRSLAEAASWFDAELFGLDARDAAALDPQQRLLLEGAWMALEDAGYNPRALPGVVSIFTAVDSAGRRRRVGSPGALGDAAFMAQVFNTKGAALSIEAGDASSLSAFVSACQSVLSYQCDIAIVAGVCLGQGARSSLASAEQSAAVVFILRRAADAVPAKDAIRAIVRGSSIDHAGAARHKSDGAFPEGWLEGTETAVAIAGLEPNSIDFMFLEGERAAPKERRALAALIERLTRDTSRALCSCSRSLGDLGAASGVAALAVVISSLARGALPPSVGLDVPESSQAWPPGDASAPRRALIASFDASGAHATVILEEPPPFESTPRLSSELIILSARSERGLEDATDALARRLGDEPHANLADVAFTLKVGRVHYPFRRALAASSPEAARDLLRPVDPRRVFTGRASAGQRPLVFLFPGLGDHYVDMGLGLYATEPTFRAEIDQAAERLRPLLGADVRDILYPDGRWTRPEAAHAALLSAMPARGIDFKSMLRARPEAETAEARRLNDARFAQPALFVIEYALARLLMERGARPSLMLGYSLGEYVAACIAGVLSLDDALRLVAERARIIAELPPGVMLAVSLSASEARGMLGDALSISAENGPSLCVVAGPEAAIAEFEGRLAASSIICRRVQSTHAFHSKMMDPAAPQLVELCRSIELRPPKIPYISNVTGAPIESSQATDPSYWATHLCRPVQFAAGAEHILGDPSRVFLEIGPGPGVAALLLQRAEALGGPPRLAVSCMRNARDRKDDVAVLQESLAKVWLLGAKISWENGYRERPVRRASLPPCPLERRRIEANDQAPPAATTTRSPHRARDVADWLYVPSWTRGVPADNRPVAPLCVILIGPQGPLGEALERSLKDLGHEVIRVSDGPTGRAPSGELTIDTTREEEYDAVLDTIVLGQSSRVLFVHLAATPHLLQAPFEPRALSEASGLFGLLSLLRAVGRRKWDPRARVVAVVSGVEDVLGDEALAPERAVALAACLCGPQEYPSIECRSVDIVLPPPGAAIERRLVEALALEVVAERAEPRTALRGAYPWTQAYAHLGARSAANAPPTLRDGGVYLITGGLGNVGLTIARHIARSARGAKLVLTARSPTPPREEWAGLQLNPEINEQAKARTRRLLDLEASGAEVVAARADVTNFDEMASLFREIDARFGRLDGVVHAAGIVGEQSLAPIRSLRREEVDRQLGPKAIGALILSRALGDRPIDFCMLVSSISTALGGVELAAYSAANLFLDALATAQNRKVGSPRWISVDWDLFSGDYLASTPAGRSLLAFAMSQEEAGDAFARALRSPRSVDRMIVCTTDLAARIEQARPSRTATRGPEPARPDTVARPDAPARGSGSSFRDYVAPRNDIERALAAKFQELLKVDRVGAHDSFFDLGGHSLVATRLIAQISELYPVDLSLRSLFESPTVAELGALIVGSLAEHADEADLAEVLASMEGSTG